MQEMLKNRIEKTFAKWPCRAVAPTARRLVMALICVGMVGVAEAASYSYTWTGASTDAPNSWTAADNWTSSNGGTTFPGVDDEAIFPATFAEGVTIQLAANQAVSNVVLNASLKLVGSDTYGLTSIQGVSGSKSLTLSGSGLASSVVVTIPKTIGIIIDANTSNWLTDNGTYKISGVSTAKTITVNGAISGEGTLKLGMGGQNCRDSGVILGGSNSSFKGTMIYEEQKDEANNCWRSSHRFTSASAGSADAIWNFNYQSGDIADNFGKFAFSNDTIYFGAYNSENGPYVNSDGSRGADNQKNNTVVIGNKGVACSCGIRFSNTQGGSRNSGITKVGGEKLTYTGWSCSYMDIDGGEVEVAYPYSIPMSRITFGGDGGTLVFGADSTNENGKVTDISGRISGSTKPISIDDGGYDMEWEGDLGTQNSGGFTKKGNGTLRLMETPAYTGKTRIQGGNLAMVKGATLEIAEIASGSKLQFIYDASTWTGASVELASITVDEGVTFTADNVAILDLPEGVEMTVGIENGKIKATAANDTGYVWKGADKAEWRATGSWKGNVTSSDWTYADGKTLFFDDTAFDDGDDAVTNEVALTSGDVSPHAATANISAGKGYKLTGTSKLTGEMSFTKKGEGDFILANGGNDFTGGVTVEAGRLSIASGDQSALSLTTEDDGTIALNGGTEEIKVGALHGTGKVSFESGRTVLTSADIDRVATMLTLKNDAIAVLTQDYSMNGNNVFKLQDTSTLIISNCSLSVNDHYGDVIGVNTTTVKIMDGGVYNGPQFRRGSLCDKVNLILAGGTVNACEAQGENHDYYQFNNASLKAEENTVNTLSGGRSDMQVNAPLKGSGTFNLTSTARGFTFRGNNSEFEGIVNINAIGDTDSRLLVAGFYGKNTGSSSASWNVNGVFNSHDPNGVDYSLVLASSASTSEDDALKLGALNTVAGANICCNYENTYVEIGGRNEDCAINGGFVSNAVNIVKVGNKKLTLGTGFSALSGSSLKIKKGSVENNGSLTGVTITLADTSASITSTSELTVSSGVTGCSVKRVEISGIYTYTLAYKVTFSTTNCSIISEDEGTTYSGTVLIAPGDFKFKVAVSDGYVVETVKAGETEPPADASGVYTTTLSADVTITATAKKTPLKAFTDAYNEAVEAGAGTVTLTGDVALTSALELNKDCTITIAKVGYGLTGTIKVTQGTLIVTSSAEWTGYTIDADYTAVSVAGNDTDGYTYTFKKSVAKVNSKGYATFEAAMTAADGNQAITLLAAVEGVITLNAGKTLIINNPNSYAISVAPEEDCVIVSETLGDVTTYGAVPTYEITVTIPAENHVTLTSVSTNDAAGTAHAIEANKDGKYVVVSNATVTITYGAEGAFTLEGKTTTATIANVSKDTMADQTEMPTATRTPSTFTWIGGASGVWASAASWTVNGLATSAIPATNDDVLFPVSDSGYKVSVSTDSYISNVTVNATLTLTGSHSIVFHDKISGSGKIVLENAYLGAAAIDGATGEIDVDVEVPEGKSATFYNWAASNDTTSYLRMNGRLLGKGTLSCGPGNKRYKGGVLFCNADSTFEGTLILNRSSYNINYTWHSITNKATFANAKIEVNCCAGNASKYPGQYPFRTLDGQTIKVGSLTGTIYARGYQTGDGLKEWLEVGTRDEDCSLDGDLVEIRSDAKVVSTGGMGFRWVAPTATMNYGVAKTSYEEVSGGGTFKIASYEALPWNRFSFVEDGGTLKTGQDSTNLVTYVDNGDGTITTNTTTFTFMIDPSPWIKSSTAAIVFDDEGTNRTWSSSLDKNNTAGLTKKGSGTLTLDVAPAWTAANKATEVITVEDGSLVIKDSSFANYTRGANTKVEKDTTNNTLTFTHEAQAVMSVTSAKDWGGTLTVTNATTSEVYNPYGGSVPEGTTITITVHRTSDYKLVGIKVNGEMKAEPVTASDTTCTYTVTSEDVTNGVEIEVTAVKRQWAHLTEKFGSGVSVVYTYGDNKTVYTLAKINSDVFDIEGNQSVTATLTIGSGYVLDSVSGGTATSTANEYAILMNSTNVVFVVKTLTVVTPTAGDTTIALTPGQAVCTNGVAVSENFSATVSTTVNGESVSLTDYYTTSSLKPNSDGYVKPELDEDKVDPINATSTMTGDASSGVAVTPGNVKAGLYYRLVASETKDGTYSGGTATQAKSDTDSLNLTNSKKTTGDNKVMYYKVEVSDTAQ